MKTLLSFSLALLCACVSALGQAVSSSGTISTNQIAIFTDPKHVKGANVGTGLSYDGVALSATGTNASVLGVNGIQVANPNFTNSTDTTVANVSSNITITITANAVTDAKLRQGAGFSVIGKSTTGTGNVADITAGTDTVLGRNGSGNLGFAQVASTQIANNAVTDSQLRQGAGFTVIGKLSSGTGNVADIGPAANDSVLQKLGSANLGWGKISTNQISSTNASAGQVIGFDGTVVVWTNAGGNVLASIDFGTDNRLIRSDGINKGVQSSAVTLDDSQNASGFNQLSASVPIKVQTDLAGGTALTVGQDYFDNFSGNRTLTFSGTPANGYIIRLSMNVTAVMTLTFPSSQPISGTGSAITSALFWVGYHEVSWLYDNSVWRFVGPGVLNNYSAAVAPTANEDAGDGYSVGSLWVDTTADHHYVCVDSTVAAAVWRQTDGSVTVDDTAFASSWNGVTTTAPSKNAVYDWGITLAYATNLPSINASQPSPNILNFANQSQGVRWNLSGTNGTAVPDTGFLVTNLNVSGGGTWAGTLTNSALTASLPVFSDAAKGLSSTGTIDASSANVTLKQTKYLQLIRPDYGDGSGAIPQTNQYTVSGLMHFTMSGSADTNANFIVYEFVVPADIDTSVAMTATFSFVNGGTDTDDYAFDITYAQGTAGSAWPPASIATSPIRITVTPTSPANGDLQKSAATTLTGWAASMTAGTPITVKVARVNNTQDDTARDVSLVIAYGSTQ